MNDAPILIEYDKYQHVLNDKAKAVFSNHLTNSNFFHKKDDKLEFDDPSIQVINHEGKNYYLKFFQKNITSYNGNITDEALKDFFENLNKAAEEDLISFGHLGVFHFKLRRYEQDPYQFFIHTFVYSENSNSPEEMNQKLGI